MVDINREISIILRPTFGYRVGFDFDRDGNYLWHGTVNVATGETGTLDISICLSELRRLINASNEPPDDTHEEWRKLNEEECG